MPSIGGLSEIYLNTIMQLQRKLESEYQIGWFRNIMADAFA